MNRIIALWLRLFADTPYNGGKQCPKPWIRMSQLPRRKSLVGFSVVHFPSGPTHLILSPLPLSYPKDSWASTSPHFGQFHSASMASAESPSIVINAPQCSQRPRPARLTIIANVLSQSTWIPTTLIY